MDRLYISELLPREDMKRVLKATGAGVETIRFGVGDYLDDLPTQYREFEEDLAYWDNPYLSFHGPFLDMVPVSYDSRIQAVTKQRFQECYEAAAHFKAERVVYHSGMIPSVYYTMGWAERMIDFWHDFLPGKTGPVVVMENVYDREIFPLADVMKDAGLSENPGFGFCLDIGHAHCYSDYPVMAWVEALGASIRHVHIHDNDMTCDAHRALGDGTIPVSDVIKAISHLPGERSWTIECCTYDDVMKSWEKWKILTEE